jgi:polyhydroxyalkanoate synthase
MPSETTDRLAVAKPQQQAERPDQLAARLSELDHWLRGVFGLAIGGQSPWTALQAWEDWAIHFGLSPERQIELWRRGTEALLDLRDSTTALRTDRSDRRFRDPKWKEPPFCLLARAQLAAEELWRTATRDVPGVSDEHMKRVEFMGQFMLNALAPVNFPWSNPQVIEAAWTTAGRNFLAGAGLLAEDFARVFFKEKLKGLEGFKVGETVAISKGDVIYRNELVELIQYAPTTDQVHVEPILLVPAWIMKYYVLDLTPQNSMVRYLVNKGFTVFVLSWKNPGSELRDITFDDYRCKGVMSAIDAISKVVPGAKIHAVGYCLGGTVLAIAAAAMCRDRDDRLASLSLIASQTDFKEVGEAMLFIDEHQFALLNDIMRLGGYLDIRPMAGAFYILRAREMLFAQFVDRYLIGKAHVPGDLDAWLSDPARMPARMHSEYLRLFLEDSFASGTCQANGRPVAQKDIQMPVFALGAEQDHIAPWRSVYKVGLYNPAATTFVLTGGGHNTGVVSPPGKPGAYYWRSSARTNSDYIDPETWLAGAQQHDGSWWPEWVDWLEKMSSEETVAPPAMGCPEAGLPPLQPAPGSYVLEK